MPTGSDFMRQRHRSVRPLVLVGTAALVAGVLSAAPARAAGPATTVTVLLKAPDPAGLAKLATATGLSHGQRMTALDRLLPGSAAHHQVIDALGSAGFAIGHETAWSVEATAPQQTVTETFGAAGHLKAAALPDIPASIDDVAAAVLPGGATGLFSPQDDCQSGCHDGGDFQNAYTSPGISPATGQDPKGTLTVATLQFANWNDADLTKYAAATLAPQGDPVASGQYKQFGVKGTVLGPATPAEKGLDEEVDLDQESLLSTDPYANQRTYINTNSSDGYVQSLSQVLADVTQGEGRSADGGDPHIVALSTSWGSCEADFGFAFPGDTINAIEPILQSLSAAGVTIFAASGDDGVYDCGLSKTSTQVGVDYPTSSPDVVGVGGTRLNAVGGNAANNGANWADTGWTCTTTVACESATGSGGTGGGESLQFPMPAYQSAGIGHHRFTTSTGKHGDFGTQPRRLVPDIAVDADPATGFDILTTDPIDACIGQVPVPVCQSNQNRTAVNVAVGGTSLSAPVAAGLFTTMLAAHGVTSGVGDIHGALYSAYAAGTGEFRDVTSGSNGHQQDVDARAATGKAAELPVSARAGYDTVTGLGAPLWPAIAPFLFSPTRPKPTAKLRLASPHIKKKATHVTASWSSKAAGHHSTLAASAHVTITRRGTSTAVYQRSHAPASGSHEFTAKPGATYLIKVTDRDLSGRVSAATTATLSVPFDDTSFRLHGRWSRVHSKGDFGGSNLVSKARAATATLTATGHRYAVLVRTGPRNGKLAVFLGPKRVKVIDLYTVGPQHRVVTFFGSAATPLKRRTFTFRFTGTKDPFSAGTTVDLDGLEALR
jgi:hypothetical protein